MKRFMAVCITLLMLVSSAHAGVVTITSGTNYVPGVDKVVSVQMPEHVWVAALNAGGVTVTGGTLVSITETFPNKTLETNGTRFVIYSLDSTVMEGPNLLFTITPNGNAQVMLTVVGIKAAGPDALPVIVEDFSHIMYSNFDYDTDGDFDDDDFLFVLQQYLASSGITFEVLVQVLHAYVNA